MSKRRHFGIIIFSLIVVIIVFCGTLIFSKIRQFDTNQNDLAEQDLMAGASLSYLRGQFTDIDINDTSSAIQAAKAASIELGFENALDDLSGFISTPVGDNTIYRMRQNFKGIPVYGRYVIVTALDNGEAASIITDAKDIREDIDLHPSVEEKQVYEKVKEYAMYNWGTVYDDLTISGLSDSSLVIYDMDESEEACLAYQLYAENGGNEYEIVVDADSGDVLESVSMFSDIAGVGVTEDGGEFPVSYDGENTYLLADEEREMYVYNFNGGNSDKDKDFISKLLPVVSRGDNVFGNTDEEKNQNYERAVLIYKTIERIADYYDSIGQGIPFGRMYIGYDDNYDNGINARGGGPLEIEPGQKGGCIFIGTEIHSEDYDTLAHEYTHSVARSYDVATRGGHQADIISEGIADTMSIFAGAYISGKEPDWDIDLDYIGYGHRNAKNPRMYGYPETLYDRNTRRKDVPHTYGVLISRAAYLMYDSGEFTLDQLQDIWFSAIVSLPSNCTFYQLNKCVELYTEIYMGKDSAQVATAREAFINVGLCGDYYRCSNEIAINVCDKNEMLYDDYSILIEGRTKSGKDVRIDDISHDDNPYKVTLDDGNYSITITDNADCRKKSVVNVNVKKDFTIRYIVVTTDFGADYTVRRGAKLTVLDANSEEYVDYSAYAEIDGVKMDINSGVINLEEKNYYTVVLTDTTVMPEITTYHIFTLRVKDGADEEVVINTKFGSGKPDESAMYQAYYDKLLELQLKYGTASVLDCANATLTGLCFAKLVDFNGDGQEKLVLAYCSDVHYFDSDYIVEVWEYADGGLQKVFEGNCRYESEFYASVMLYNYNGQYLLGETISGVDEYSRWWEGNEDVFYIRRTRRVY